MKICQISNLYDPWIIGGAEIYVERLSNALSEEHKVIVITTEPFSGLKSFSVRIENTNNVKIYRLCPINVYHTYNAKKKPELIKPLWHGIDLWNPHAYFIVRRILEKEKPDVVHTHNLGGLSMSVSSLIRSLGVPHVHTLHDYALFCPRANLLKGNGKICDKPHILCKIYKNVKKKLIDPNVVISPSKFVLNLHTEVGFFKNSITVVEPNGIPITNKKPIKKNFSCINTVYVGQITKSKGVHILINAFRELKEDDVRLHIVGKGPDFTEFKTLAKGDDRIIFYGFVPEYQLKELYSMANLVVVPSIWYENSPTVIYESFTSSTPVVGSRIGGIPELVVDGYNGYTFEAGNIDELKSILENLVRDIPKLKKLGMNAFEYVRKYDINKHTKKIVKIYETITE